MSSTPPEPNRRIQLQLVLPYRLELASHPTVSDYLARGFRVAQLTRLTDREVLVTFEAPAAPLTAVGSPAS